MKPGRLAVILVSGALLASCPMPDRGVPAQLPPPELDPPGGEYAAPLTVRCATDYSWCSSFPASGGVRFRYTTDGSDPATSATAVEAATLEVELASAGDWTVRALALDSWFFWSSFSEASYTLSGP